MDTVSTEVTVKDEDLDISPAALIKTVQTKRLKMLLGTEDMDKHKRYLMNEISETAVQCLKIESDEKTAGDDRDAAIAIASVIGGLKENPFYVAGGRANTVMVEVPDVPLLPGETGTELEILKYSDFVDVETK